MAAPELTTITHDNETGTGLQVLQPGIENDFTEVNAADADGQETSTTPLDESVDSSLPEDDSAQSMDCPEGNEPATIEIEDLSDDGQLEPEGGPFPTSEDLQGSPTNAIQASVDLVAPALETGSEVEHVEDVTTSTVDRDDLSALPTQTLPENLEVSQKQTPVETTGNANGSDTFEVDFEFHRLNEDLVAIDSEIQTNSAGPELQPEIDIEFPETNVPDADGQETSTAPLDEWVDSSLPEDDSDKSKDCPEGIEPETTEIEVLSANSQHESEAGLKKLPIADELCELHNELHEHFSRLFENRAALGLGVFLLEHEIEEDKFERVVSSIRDCLQSYSLADHGWWWAARYLPLLVCGL